ncbi:MAG: hypothetical protein ACON4G_07285 [Candidatus Puniceispirillaceae bacterium]
MDKKQSDKSTIMLEDSFDSGDADCHFITLAEIIEDYDGQLADYQKKTGARNVIITMTADISVGGGKAKSYAAALAVTSDYAAADDLLSLATTALAPTQNFAFGWVPANLYGKDDFGIFIEANGLGEKLANGLIDDVIVSAHVEQAVMG